MADPKDLSQFRVLITGLDAVCRPLIDHLLAKEQILEVSYDLEKLMELEVSPPPVMLIFGPPPEGVSLNETAQVARMQYQTQPIYFLTSIRTNFNRKDIQKNGFTDAFLIPIDLDTVKQTVKDELSKATKGAIRSYRQVQLVDIRPNETLAFDTYMYMPVNKKHIKMSVSGDDLDQSQYEKMTKSQMNSVHVTSDQIQNFYEFTAQKLVGLQKGDGLSETERKERMTGAIRNLMSSVFNDSSSDATIDAGRSIVTDCQEIVKTFIVSADEKNKWYEKMLAATGAESGSYNHAGNVATFGTLFSLAVGLGKADDIALAGLIHDMGLADVPADIQTKEESQRTKEEEEQYRKHVDHTLSIIKFRKMILPDSVTKAIAQHHERWSGTGYPRGLAGSRITIEAQILALANIFDHLTMTKEGKARMSPAKAFKLIYEENLNHSSTASFDLELLKKFLVVFPEES
ncbi:MAG: HD domain-containing protein [Cryobacterium sp.]|nr:HD domain-containing protein [Oligoflexia bacterium]